MRHRRPTTRPAFSLVELSLTALIIALFAAMALPRYASSLARYRLDGAARRVQAEIERARSSAVARSTSVTVRFNLNTDVLTVSGVRGLANEAGDATTNLAAEPYFCDVLAASFGGAAMLTFDGYGKPLSGGSVTLQGGAAPVTLTVDAETGGVSRP